jgi:hypothetical protein
MRLLKGILKTEAGQALPMALLLLALGGFLVVPTLGLMTTNLTANRVVDRANLELYAADAGVEDALWNIKYGTEPQGGWAGWQDQLDLNDKTVNVTISKQTDQPYKITSTASADGHSTTVQCFVNTQADFSWLFEHAITSGGDVWTKKSDIINGGILYEGTFDDNAQVTGEVVNKPVTLPTAAELSPFYWEDVKTLTPYPTSSYVIPGGTPSSPHMIPSLYRNGNLSITGSGYAKLSGTVYVKGNFSVDDKDSIINLNGQTIYAEGTVYFKPGCTIYGPGCIIAVGDVDFQPNMGMGDKLLGVNDMSASEVDSPNMFLLSKFQAVKSGKLTSFQVKCSGPGKVKVALYADSSGAPGALLGAVDTDTDVMAADWTPINFPETQVNSGTYYWLAAISDSAIIYRYATSSTNKYKPASYSDFTFPNPAGSGFSSQDTKQYMFAGYEGSQEFIFVMSLTGNTNVQPGGSFYGSIAGNAYVNLQPNCTVQLVGLPAGGLNFPGGDSGGEGTGNQVKMLTYTIQ